jgi:hypothetical protein
MAMTLKLIRLDEHGVRQNQDKPGTLRLVCLIGGGGKLAVWGSDASRENIDKVLNTGTPCEVECECVFAREPWITKFGHTYWLPDGRKLSVKPK